MHGAINMPTKIFSSIFLSLILCLGRSLPFDLAHTTTATTNSFFRNRGSVYLLEFHRNFRWKYTFNYPNLVWDTTKKKCSAKEKVYRDFLPFFTCFFLVRRNLKHIFFCSLFVYVRSSCCRCLILYANRHCFVPLSANTIRLHEKKAQKWHYSSSLFCFSFICFVFCAFFFLLNFHWMLCWLLQIIFGKTYIFKCNTQTHRNNCLENGSNIILENFFASYIK